jgi:hypothetical protein
MRLILCLTTILAFGFAPAPVYRAKPNPVADDLALLQGRWIRTVQTFDDKPSVSDNKTLVVFEKTVLAFPMIQYRITLDLTKKERVMSLHYKNETPAYVAFYRVSGDELILCFSHEKGVAPKSIAGGRGMYVFAFKRAPKP